MRALVRKRTTHRTWLVFLLAVFLCLVLTGILVELTLRAATRLHVRFTADQVFEKARIEAPDDYDLIAIGDSFVETGKWGWTRLLEQRGWRVLNLGAGGACPAQYFEVFRTIRPRLTRRQTVLIVLYIGNDFADQKIWDALGANKELYFSRRASIFSSDSTEMFWPLRGSTPGNARMWLRNHSYAIRFASTLRVALASRFQEQESLAKIMMNQIDHRFAYTAGDNVFFIRHHNAISYDAADEGLQRAAEHILALVESVKEDERLYIVPVLDREEISASIHGQQIRKNAFFIRWLEAASPRVLDVNDEFLKEFSLRNLYLPDGHWSAEGHRLFAELVDKRLKAASLN